MAAAQGVLCGEMTLGRGDVNELRTTSGIPCREDLAVRGTQGLVDFDESVAVEFDVSRGNVERIDSGAGKGRKSRLDPPLEGPSAARSTLL